MITLYDCQFDTLPGKSVSPFVAKVRIALGYKNIPYKTVFFKLSEFTSKATELGLPVNDLDTDGPPRHKVPMIHDPKTGAKLCDSTRIILYLERTYPDTPRIVPPGAEALAVSFDDVVRTHVTGSIAASVCARLALLLTEPIRAGYAQGIEAAYLKMPLNEFLANPEFERAIWEKAEGQFDVVDKLLRKAQVVARGDDVGLYMGGKTLTYVDLCLGAVLAWAKRGLGSGTDGDEYWKKLQGWNEGRWARLHEQTGKYTVVHDT